jgi:aminoglycoside phosphotransferase (APT) family kinase protein
MAREGTAIRAAAQVGVPEPEVIAYSDSSELLGGPFVLMSRVDGESVPRRILSSQRFADVRPRLADRCGEILAQIHSIPADAICDIDPKPRDVISDLRSDLDLFEEVSPAFELGMQWLNEYRIPEVAPTVVHGDFRNGNLLVDERDIQAVLDWEFVHLGDPMEDLGYLCARAWRFGRFEQPVGGFGGYDSLFAGYERTAGIKIDRQRVRWWELFGAVKWGLGCMVQSWRHLSGDSESIELAAVGRRAWEQEYDVLLLLRDFEKASG